MYSYTNNTTNCKETSKINSNDNAKTPLYTTPLPYYVLDLKNRIDANAGAKKVFNGFLNRDIVYMEAENFSDDYDTIGKFAFRGCDSLESVVIPNSVRKIEFGAFAHLKNLKKVFIPDSVETIEAYAFFDCPKLTEVKLSESLTTIESGTFASCKSLRKIRIPDSVSKIESFAFENCSRYFIATNVLPSARIDFTAFSKGKDSYVLKSDKYERPCFKIKNRLKNTKEYKHLKKSKYDECIDVGNTYGLFKDKDEKKMSLCEQDGADYDSYTTENNSEVSFIYYSYEEEKDNEISDDMELKMFEITVTKSGTSKNEAKTAKVQNSVAKAENMIVIKYEDSKNTLSSNKVTVCNIKLLDNMTIIGQKMFDKYPNIKEIDLSNAKSVTTIDSGTFIKCKQLEYIKLPPNLKELGSLAFYKCRNLKKIDLSKLSSLTTIASSTFSGCLRLSEIKFPPGLKQIDGHAFALCVNLNKIDFLNAHSLESIGESAFLGCKKLTEIKLPKSLNCICKQAFSLCDNLKKVDLSESISLKEINELTFGDCSKLSEIILPGNLKAIKDGVFQKCNNLTNIKLPESIEIIKRCAFFGCKSLEKINLPKTLGGINPAAFYNCHDIKFDVAFDRENIKIASDNEFADGDKFNKSALPLYINGGPQYSDVKQGQVGDCSLMSFLASLAKYQPQKIKDILSENKEDDTVTVTLYPFGVKMQYTVTKLLPEYLLKDTKCIWFRMIEKAIAFVIKDLEYVKNDDSKMQMKQCLCNSGAGGVLNDVSMLLFGRPSEYYRYSKEKEISDIVFKREYKKKQLDMFSLISSNLKNNNIITLSISKNDKGFYSNHAYSVLDARIDEVGRLLIKIRNPHNRTSDKRYYAIRPSGEFTLIQEPYLYDDDDRGPTSKTQAETELDLNMLYEMHVDYKICVLNAYEENNLSFEKEKYNTIKSLKDKSGLNFCNIKKTDDTFDPQNIERIEDTAEVNFDKSNFIKENHLQEKHVVVPQGVTAITYGAFTRIESNGDKPILNCNNKIESIVLSSSVKHVDESAFYQCSNLMKVDFSKAASLKTIGSNAFESCINLDNVKLPDNLQEIDDEAFLKCFNLRSISFPPNMNKLGNGVFLGCQCLEKVDLSKLSFLKTTGIKTFACCNKLSEVKLPDTIEEIGQESFYHCINLDNFKFPSQLINIGLRAFSGYSSLQTADLSNVNSLKTIGVQAFAYCNNLSSIRFPDSLNEIQWESFSKCPKLQNIKFPSQLSKIGNASFGDCQGLRTVDFSNAKALKVISDKSFIKCKNLSELKLPDTLKEIGSESFSLCSQLKSFEFPLQLCKIGTAAFAFCNSLQRVDLSLLNSLKEIGKLAFVKCSDLSDLEFPISLQEIGEQAFRGCLKLQNIKFPSKLSKIGVGAFAECHTLKTADFSEANNLKSITARMFAVCAGLSDVKFPNTLQRIENKSFYECVFLKGINLPSSLKMIGEKSFYQCLSLKSIKFPKALKQIGKDAFAGCAHLTEIDFSALDSLAKIDANAFDLNKIKKVIIKRRQEKQLTSAYGFNKTVFQYCD